ncbi:Pre-rRNA-processing protein fhl1 [Marasmius crinis-equi]|uniref:Pre-rRNA-processing protein fhl1 n=1 Tax=Marasmius crinis-equi TaxID=585013 RepID=A0ABR3FEH4_9AGAR
MPVVAHDNDEDGQQPSKISAYYSLVFPHFTFYIQTLSVTIGRRCSPPAQPPASSSTSTADPVQVDVDLGALKSVSRLHAKIEYDQEQDRFVLQVIGRNGAWVDGVWQGSGTRAALGERSQIQIASRTFHFVLPPPPPPEDTPSPPSEELASDSPATTTTTTNPSIKRARSPSLDITSISPPESLPEPDPPEDPPIESKPPTPPPPAPVVSGKSKPSKKRKKRDSESAAVDILSPEPSHPPTQPTQTPTAGVSGKHPKVEEPKPKLKPGEEMPPKPSLTYAQLIFRAIKALDGKATLQEICNWIAKEFDYYRYVEGNAWTSSIRHNLSSGRAFKKMERCGGDRGKGFFWSLDEAHLHTLEEQDARLLLNAAAGGKKGGKDKDKVLEPALKRSVKGDAKGPLPPPLTNTPLPLPTASKTIQATVVKPNKAASEKTAVGQTGVFAYGTGYAGHPNSTLTSSNPYAVLTQSPWGIPGKYPYGPPPPMPQAVKSPPPTASTQQQSQQQHVTSATGASGVQQTQLVQPQPSTSPSTKSVQTPPAPQPAPQPSTSATPTPVASSSLSPSIPPALESVIVPIVISPPSAAPPKAPMLLQDSKIILDPSIFSDLTPDMLSALEKLGARQAIHVLTGHMTRVLKEREKRGKSKKKDKEGKKRDKDKSRKKDKEKEKEKDKERDKEKMEVDGAISTNAGADAGQGPSDRPDSPIIVIDDDEDDGPAPKRRKLTNDPAIASNLPVVQSGLQTVSAMS